MALLQLSNLYGWAGNGAQALALAERAVEFAPASQDAHNRLVQTLGGTDAIVARYMRFREVHPDEPLGWWYAGSALFDAGITAYAAGDLQPERTIAGDDRGNRQ